MVTKKSVLFVSLCFRTYPSIFIFFSSTIRQPLRFCTTCRRVQEFDNTINRLSVNQGWSIHALSLSLLIAVCSIFGMVRNARTRGRKDEAPAGVFANRNHRTSKLIKGATDEIVWKKHLAEQCTETIFEVHLLPAPDSEWIPSSTDMNTFGIAATNEPTAYLMTIDLEDIDSILPSIGSTVEVHLAVDQVFHTVPKFPIGFHQLQILAEKIQDLLACAEAETYYAETDIGKKINDIMRDEDCRDGTIRRQEIADSITFEHYHQKATEYLWQYNANISDETIRKNPLADNEVHRWYDALQFASDLRMTARESEADHLHRIKDWIRQKEVTCCIALDDVPCVGRRIKLPRGITADVALFYLKVPLQPNWPKNRVQPPITLRVPKRPFPTNLKNYFLNVTKGFSQGISAEICYTINLKPIRMECSAVKAMDQLEEESLAYNWWKFLIRFDDISASRRIDLLKWFPALQTQLNNGVYQGEYAKAIKAMAESRTGKVFITGSPGSDRSIFTASIAQAVMSQAPNPLAALSFMLDPISECPKWEVDAIVQAQPVEQWDDDPLVIRPTYWENFYREKKQQKIKHIVESQSGSGRVAWIAPQNVQVDDAVRQLAAMNPDKTIIRIYCYNDELNNLLATESESSAAIPASHATTRTPAHQIAEAYSSFQVDRDTKRNPGSDRNSWSEHCRRMVQAEPSRWWQMLEAWDRRDNDPTMYDDDRERYIDVDDDDDRERYIDVARNVLKLQLQKADVICATPIAFATMAKHIKWEPSFIIVDNAGQLTEAMTILPVSVCPDVPIMFIGDTEKTGPIVEASRDSRQKASSTKQRTHSLLQRVEEAGCLDFRLSAGR